MTCQVKNGFVQGWEEEQAKNKARKKIANTLGTRADCIEITRMITDNSGAQTVHFKWLSNAGTKHIALISTLGLLKIYAEVN